jgi:hypothetical protein
MIKAKQSVSAAEREHYIRHIKRLQEQNRLLAEVIASERKARKGAYAWYFNRLQSKFWFVVDYMLWSQGSLRRRY